MHYLILYKNTHSVLWLTSEQKQAHVSPGLKDPYCLKTLIATDVVTQKHKALQRLVE